MVKYAERGGECRWTEQLVVDTILYALLQSIAKRCTLRSGVPVARWPRSIEELDVPADILQV
jgi:hypothetical protein